MEPKIDRTENTPTVILAQFFSFHKFIPTNKNKKLITTATIPIPANMSLVIPASTASTSKIDTPEKKNIPVEKAKKAKRKNHAEITLTPKT